MTSPSGLVCVVGSLNDDITLSVGALPAPGETTLTQGVRSTSPGGKGANQAAAAAVLGARVIMVGAVGEDEPGERALAALRQHDIDLTGVVRRPGACTGVAVITVDAEGENTIVVDAGANGSLTAQEAAQAVSAARPAVLLLQLEVPLDAVQAAAGAAAAAGAVVVLNPAPMPPDPGPVRDLLRLVDVLVPNCSELGRLAGRPEPTDVVEVAACVAALDHPGSVVVTLGAGGAVCFDWGAEPVVVPGLPTATRDASGAGDVFCGCLAQQLAAGVGLLEAVRRANTLAAASTAHPGARLRADLPELAATS